jgi:hypothetical protein
VGLFFIHAIICIFVLFIFVSGGITYLILETILVMKTFSFITLATDIETYEDAQAKRAEFFRKGFTAVEIHEVVHPQPSKNLGMISLFHWTEDDADWSEIDEFPVSYTLMGCAPERHYDPVQIKPPPMIRMPIPYKNGVGR